MNEVNLPVTTFYTVHTTTNYAPAKLLYGRLIPVPDKVFQKPLDVEDRIYSKPHEGQVRVARTYYEVRPEEDDASL